MKEILEKIQIKKNSGKEDSNKKKKFALYIYIYIYYIYNCRKDYYLAHKK